MKEYYYYRNYINLSMYVSEQIKRIRESLKYTQEDVAHYLGITRQAYSKLENNITTINVNLLENLCSYFKVGLTEFFPEHLLEGSPFQNGAAENLSYQYFSMRDGMKQKLMTKDILKLISGYASLSQADRQTIMDFIDHRLI